MAERNLDFVKRKCKVCQSVNRVKIEEDVINRLTPRVIAVRWGVGEQSVERHRADHMPADWLNAYIALNRLEEVMNVPDKMRESWELLQSLLSHALRPLMNRRNDSDKAVLDAHDVMDKTYVVQLMRETRAWYEMMLRVHGAIPPDQQNVNVLITHGWHEIVTNLQARLGETDPDFKAAFSSALLDMPAEFRPGYDPANTGRIIEGDTDNER